MHYSEHSVCMCRRADRKLTGTAPLSLVQQTDSEVLIEVHILTWNRILLALCKLSSVYPNVARIVSREAHTRCNILLSGLSQLICVRTHALFTSIIQYRWIVENSM